MIKSKKGRTAVAAALAMGMAASAFAQDGRFDRGPDRHERYERHEAQDPRFDGHGRPDFRPQALVVGRGTLSPYAQWHRGDRLPATYRTDS
jgi:Ni/Co efflux regulator RcnB